MKITVDLPDDLAQHADPGRAALEALAIAGYRSGELTHHQASQLLGLSRFEFDGFLKEREISRPCGSSESEAYSGSDCRCCGHFAAQLSHPD